MSDSSSIGIVGGGIAGLIAGCTLQEQGIKTVVLERSKSLNTDGAGISISPNGLRVLEKLKLKDHFKKTSFAPNNVVFHQNNREISNILSPNKFITSSRHNLLQLLYQKYIELNEKSKSLDEDIISSIKDSKNFAKKIEFSNDLFQEIGVTRYCCKRHLLTHVDLIEKI